MLRLRPITDTVSIPKNHRWRDAVIPVEPPPSDLNADSDVYSQKIHFKIVAFRLCTSSNNRVQWHVHIHLTISNKMAEDTHVKHSAHLTQGAPEYTLHMTHTSPPPPNPSQHLYRWGILPVVSGETRQQTTTTRTTHPASTQDSHTIAIDA